MTNKTLSYQREKQSRWTVDFVEILDRCDADCGCRGYVAKTYKMAVFWLINIKIGILIKKLMQKSDCVIGKRVLKTIQRISSIFGRSGGNMRKSVLRLLSYGWPDKIIANYLMIKPTIVKYYRKKHRIARNEYQGFY
jgi:hypothetical protein